MTVVATSGGVPAGVAVQATCTACGTCLVTCPVAALLPAPKRPLVDAGACTGCLACVEICPAGAIVPVATAGTRWLAIADVPVSAARTAMPCSRP